MADAGGCTCDSGACVRSAELPASGWNGCKYVFRLTHGPHAYVVAVCGETALVSDLGARGLGALLSCWLQRAIATICSEFAVGVAAD